MDPSRLRAEFLSSDTVYIRAYVEADKESTQAWAGAPFPVGSLRGERLLAEWHKEYRPSTRRFALCRSSTDEIVGGTEIDIRHLVADVRINMAPWLEDADALRAAGLELLVRWLSDEWSMVAVTAAIPSDYPRTIAAAEGLGMIHAGTMREIHARPGGTRADDLYYQKLRSMEVGVNA